jgi:hypothetical protein
MCQFENKIPNHYEIECRIVKYHFRNNVTTKIDNQNVPVNFVDSKFEKLF